MARLPNQKMTPGVPPRPSTLSKEAAAAWDEIVAELVESGIRLSKAHRTLLETAATLMADIADARETVDTEGAYLENPKTGVMQMHPAARRLDSLRRDFIKTMSALGMRSAAPGGDSKKVSMSELLDA